MPVALRNQVQERAKNQCEYCHTSELWQYVPFTIDHIIPLSLGGTDDPENLALACFHCNRRKSNQCSGIDPETQSEVPLFHPRLQAWSEHFIWSQDGLKIIGLSETGRATIVTLNMNRERTLRIRAADVEVGRHPPNDDPIESENDTDSGKLHNKK